MKEFATIKFNDQEAGDEAIAIVRGDETKIGLCLSLMKDGDIEVFMLPSVCKELVEALQQALSTVDRDR
jgi:hypothetical protein